MATVEAPVHENVKRQIVANDERSTTMIFRKFRNTARVAKNTISTRVAELEREPDTTFDDIAELVSGRRGRERVLGEGSMEDGLWWAGQTQGLIHDVPTCAEVVARIVADAEAAIDRLSGYAGRTEATS